MIIQPALNPQSFDKNDNFVVIVTYPDCVRAIESWFAEARANQAAKILQDHAYKNGHAGEYSVITMEAYRYAAGQP